jgi:ankyrin repeat protein
LLFEHGVKLQYCDKAILFLPIAHNLSEIVKLLLKNGASVTAKLEGMKPIEWAAHYGSDEVYNVLIEHGAKPLTQKEKSLYHFIYLAGNADIKNTDKMDMLLKDGIYINGENSKGEGAITEAVSFPAFDAGRYLMVKYLIEKGVDINRSYKVDGVNQTALHAAVYGTYFALTADISQFKKEESKKRLNNEQFYCKKVLEGLIQAGAHISSRDEYERTPLHIAAKYNNLIAAEMLIGGGAKLMDKDNDGKTPLDYAKSGEMIKLLKSHGAKEQ